jgi:hypothetical protein
MYVVQKELGYSSTLSDKFCSVDRDSNCNTLIKQFKLPFGLSLGDISLVYFSLLIFQSLTQNLSLLVLLSITTIPAILFSLIYQSVIAKKWCVLCLGIVSVLTIQLAINLAILNTQLNFSTPLLKSLTLYLFTFLSVLFIWKALKVELAKTAEITGLKIENLRFRRDYNLFMAFYNSQPIVETSLPLVPEITLGNANAPVELLVVSNPMCEPCAEAHLIYDELLTQYPDELCLKMRFFVPLEDDKDPRTIAAGQLLMLSKLLGNSELKTALHLWYTKKQFSTAVNELLSQKNINDFIPILGAHKNWCLSNQIQITPTILINGRLFSDHYQISDIKNFIDELIAQETTIPNNAYLSSYNI